MGGLYYSFCTFYTDLNQIAFKLGIEIEECINSLGAPKTMAFLRCDITNLLEVSVVNCISDKSSKQGRNYFLASLTEHCEGLHVVRPAVTVHIGL